MIIGVSGPNGAGKGEVVRYLADRSFEPVSLSDVIREEVERRGLTESRERMIAVGTELRAAHGEGALATLIIAKFLPGRSYAVDSIRHPAEVDGLRGCGRGFRLIWVDADLETRFLRLQSRGRIGDPDSLSELHRLEQMELGSDDPAAQQLAAVESLADLRVANDGTLEGLHQSLQRVFEGVPVPREPG